MENRKLILEELNRIQQIMYGDSIILEMKVGSLVNKAVISTTKTAIKNAMSDLVNNLGKNAFNTLDSMRLGFKNIDPDVMLKIQDDIAASAFSGKKFNNLSPPEQLTINNWINSPSQKQMLDDAIRIESQNAINKNPSLFPSGSQAGGNRPNNPQGGGRNNPNNPQGGGRNNPNNPQGGGQGGANQLNWVRSVSDKQQKLIRDLYKKHKENRAYARKWAIGAGIGALAFAILWERLMREDETNTDELCPDGQYFDDEKQTCVTIPPPPPPPSPGCTDFPYKQGCKSPIISDIQNCLGELTVDGNYGPKTRERLIELGYDTLITKEVYDKIMKNCGGKPDEDENDNKRADDRAYDDEY